MTLTNQVAWMAKVGVAEAEADAAVGKSHKVDGVMAGDGRPVPLTNAVHSQSGDTSIWKHTHRYAHGYMSTYTISIFAIVTTPPFLTTNALTFDPDLNRVNTGEA